LYPLARHNTYPQVTPSLNCLVPVITNAPTIASFTNGQSFFYLRRNLLSGKLLADGGAVELDVPVAVAHDAVRDLPGLVVDLGHLAADEALDGEEGVLGVDDGLALGDLAYEALPGLGVGDDGGRGAVALGVGDDGGLAALHGRHGGVGGAEVDPHHLLARDPQHRRPSGGGGGRAHPHRPRRQAPTQEGRAGRGPGPAAGEEGRAGRRHRADLGGGEGGHGASATKP
jgi:hypothetical protein